MLFSSIITILFQKSSIAKLNTQPGEFQLESMLHSSRPDKTEKNFNNFLPSVVEFQVTTLYSLPELDTNEHETLK